MSQTAIFFFTDCNVAVVLYILFVKGRFLNLNDYVYQNPTNNIAWIASSKKE